MTFASSLRREQSTLARERLGRGLKFSAAAMMLIGLSAFIGPGPAHPRLGLSIAAWVVLAATAAFVLPDRFSTLTDTRWGFAVIMVACALVVALDIAGSWTGRTDGPYPQAATAVGGILLTCVNTRRARATIFATAILCAALITTFLTSLDGDVLAFGPRIVVVVLAVVPPVIGLRIVRSFGVLVQVESDRAQVHSTVSAPGIAVGMMASQDLARLDLDAERLLDAVATGRAPLPLDPEAAASAARIATELRLRLIAGRGKTWLHHAVSESAVLGPRVTVTDPDGCAALLSTAQRDALLSAVWLFAGDLSPQTQSLRVNLRNRKNDTGRRHNIAIGVEARGVPRRQVDPAVWQAISKVGRYAESNRGAALCVDIDCRLERPAEL